MTRISLRWILLWPILLTVSIGFVALALYVERSARSDQIAAVDDELVRVEQRVADGPPGRPSAADTTEAAADVPVQLVVDPDGVLLETFAGSNPFTAEQIEQLAGHVGAATIGSAPRTGFGPHRNPTERRSSVHFRSIRSTRRSRACGRA